MFTVTINRCQETILKNSNKVSILVSIFLFAPLVSHVLHKLRIRISANRSFNEVLQLHFSHPLNASCFLRILRIWCVLSIFMFQRILPTSLKQNSYLCKIVCMQCSLLRQADRRQLSLSDDAQKVNMRKKA